MKSERNAQTIIILHDLQENIPGFRDSRFGRIKLPGKFSDALEYANDTKLLINLADNVRSSFSGPWNTSELFELPPEYSNRNGVSLAHAQLEICKNDLRSLLATVSIYSRDERFLAQFEEILENIYFSLNSVEIHDENAIQMTSMKSPYI